MKQTLFYFLATILFTVSVAYADTATINVNKSCGSDYNIRIESEPWGCTIKIYSGQPLQVEVKNNYKAPCIYQVIPVEKAVIKNIFVIKGSGPIKLESKGHITVTCEPNENYKCACKK